MRYDKELIKEIKNLRAKGATYSEILKRIKIFIPKSTLSKMCEDVKLPKSYYKKIKSINKKNFSKARELAWRSNKIKREKFLLMLLESNQYLLSKLKNKDILKIILSILHITEGAKWKTHRGLMFGNSDPCLIQLYVRLLGLCYGIKTDKLKCRINYRADQNIKNLQRYWSRITKIPSKNFYKTQPDPRTIGKITKNKNYKGICVIFCSGTRIQLELEVIPQIILRACSSAG